MVTIGKNVIIDSLENETRKPIFIGKGVVIKDNTTIKQDQQVEIKRLNVKSLKKSRGDLNTKVTGHELGNNLVFNCKYRASR